MSQRNFRGKIPESKKQKSLIRRLTVLYIASLSIIACSSVVGQILIQRSLAQQELDIAVVTTAQRQQILSQQLMKTALVLKLARNPANRRQQITKLQDIVRKWEQERQKLQQMETAVNMTSGRSNRVRGMIQQLNPASQQMLDAARELITTGGFEANPLLRSDNLGSKPLRQMLSMEEFFIQGIDRSILTYNQHTAAEVVYVRQLETCLMCLTILVLVLEGVLIFRPAVAEISLTLTDLAQALQTTKDTASLLANEQEKSEHLLLNILPGKIAQRLKESSTTIADSFASVTVLFADIVGFTQLSTQVSPQELVALLNTVFSSFDKLAETHGLEKIKTIGDAYMVVGGLPNPRPDHAEAIASMALDMLEVMTSLNSETGSNCNIRIGINTGPVVAGVIGIKKFIYDLWGDTVNIASRMESHGLPGCIQITEETKEIIQDKFILDSRGVMQIKGKGEMQTYLVIGRKE